MISGKLHSNTVDKANVLNQRFQSVFTPKCPLKLSQLASMAVQDLSDSGTIDPSQIPGECLNTTPHMESITVSTKGIAKLLKDLNPHKAAGPDQIKPLVLQNLRDMMQNFSHKYMMLRLSQTAWVIPCLGGIGGPGEEVFSSLYEICTLQIGYRNGKQTVKYCGLSYNLQGLFPSTLLPIINQVSQTQRVLKSLKGQLQWCQR